MPPKWRAFMPKSREAALRNWTEDHDTDLKRLALSGNSAATIAARLGRSEAAVRTRASNLGVSFNYGVIGGDMGEDYKCVTITERPLEHGPRPRNATPAELERDGLKRARRAFAGSWAGV